MARDEGVDGSEENDCADGGMAWRRGDAVRRCPMMVPSCCCGCCCRSPPSRTDVRTGELGGKASSAGLRRCLVLLGDPEGLSGRSSGAGRIRPATSNPGMERVRDMGGGAKLAADLDRVWVPESGDVVLGL